MKIKVKGGYIKNKHIQCVYNSTPPICWDYKGNQYELEQPLYYNQRKRKYQTLNKIRKGVIKWIKWKK